MKRLLIMVSMLIGFGGAASACPDFSLWGAERFETSGAVLQQRRDFNVAAGGDNFIGNCPNVVPRTDRGAGYFTTAPDFSFDLSGMGGMQLVISVVSQCDAALLINTATTGWFYDDDDNGNLDPRIVLTQPANGVLDIWIGTFDGAVCNSVLSLETF